MKIRKKTAMAISFAVGTILFATTAMAEVASKSGYDQLKDGLKYTAQSCSSKLQSYTLDMSMAVKDNGNIINSNESINKYDLSKNSMETQATRIDSDNTKAQSYYYKDSSSRINYDSNNNIYYVSKLKEQSKSKLFENPFDHKESGDIEKIADAVIGNLKDYVVVKQNADGTKELSGSLSEAQIPALVNAVASYQVKQSFGGYRTERAGISQKNMPKITNDIFVKEFKGKMVLNKDGLIQNVLVTGVISGKDDGGSDHSLTFEILGKLENVNSTAVNKPDLSGKKVQESVEKDYNKLTNPEKYIGKYKSDMVIEKDGKFQKIGERIIEIKSMDDKNVSGTYHEEYAKGFENYAANKNDLNFSAKFGDHFNANFTASDSSGKNHKGNVDFPPNESTIYFDFEGNRNDNIMYSGQYSRVFD
jgi:hypothetical protein